MLLSKLIPSVFFYCSKLQSESPWETISVVVGDARENKSNFTETIELQIGLKTYEPQRDKDFSGSVTLHPTSPYEGLHAW